MVVESGKRYQVRAAAVNIAAGDSLDVIDGGTVSNATPNAVKFTAIESVDNSGGSAGDLLVAVEAV